MLARLYGRGAAKYAAHNWRRGYPWSLSFAALQRHAWAFWNGEDIDAEMGLPHLAAVAFHAFALLEFMESHPSFDDRWDAEESASDNAVDQRAAGRRLRIPATMTAAIPDEQVLDIRMRL
jgi:hypothetical protein